jgi:hypothetical protein
MTAYVPEEPIDFGMRQKTSQDNSVLSMCSKYTITCNYGQIGEGRTIAISSVVAESAPAALQVFAQSLTGGEWLVLDKSVDTVSISCYIIEIGDKAMNKQIQDLKTQALEWFACEPGL